MENTKLKRIGTREEVFKGLALNTAGGLKKDDIIEKKIGSRILYISKKLSDKMKENINVIRINNPHFFKRIQKKTQVNTDSNLNTNTNINTQVTNTNSNTSNSNTSNISKANEKKKNSNSNHRTQKLAFKVKENEVRTVFYPELKGMNLKELKEELIREEAEEDMGISLPGKNAQTEFKIEELPDIDLNDL